MPFQLTHLHIAKRLHQLRPNMIHDLSQFYLGAIAPDAVHIRVGYISDDKKKSHLCVGEERWGLITNNEEWIDNVLMFLDRYKNSDNYDFILGYSCHILSDIYNNIAVWTPFRLKYPDELLKGYGGLYHQESEKVEIELAIKDENQRDFWVYLENAEAISLEDLIFAEEIEKHKENILYNWFRGKQHQDMSSNALVTIESTMNFVEEATQFIISKMEEKAG